jgi:hypothetical protein
MPMLHDKHGNLSDCRCAGLLSGRLRKRGVLVGSSMAAPADCLCVDWLQHGWLVD